MNPSPTFKKRVLAREWVAGTFLNLGSPVVTEISAGSGLRSTASTPRPNQPSPYS